MEKQKATNLPVMVLLYMFVPGYVMKLWVAAAFCRTI